MVQVKIEAAKPEHFPAILENSRQTYEDHKLLHPEVFNVIQDSQTPIETAVKQAINARPNKLSTWFVFVCLVDTRFAGHVLFAVVDNKNGDHELLIADISFSDEFKGQGLGTEMLEFVHSWARENCVTRISATVWTGNHASIALFQGQGYTVNHMDFSLRLAEPKMVRSESNWRRVFKRPSDRILFFIVIIVVFLIGKGSGS